MKLFHYTAYEPAFASELLAIGVRATKPNLSLVAAALLLPALWSSVSMLTAIVWLGLLVLSTIYGQWYCRKYRDSDRAGLALSELRRAEWLGVLYSASTGAVWGLSSQLMIAEAAAHILVVMIVYFGVAAGASAMMIVAPARQLARTGTALLLFLLPFPQIFPEHWAWVMLMVAAYDVIMARAAWARNQIVISNLRLRHEKDQLLEQQRRETERANVETLRANRANQEKSAFLAAASHDLRQPLHAMMLTSHALSLRMPEGENLDLVLRILEAGRALSAQFNHLMDLSRLESGTYRVNVSVFSLPGLLQQIAASHRHVAEIKGVRLRLRLDRHLQQSALNTDAGLLNRVLDNLVGNAIKFCNPGAAVLITARKSGPTILLAVHDRGIGIPEAELANIFKPYVQLNNPARDLHRGIGLGLSIVSNAAALLGGRVTVRSMPGRGSRFVLSLPATLSQPLVPTALGAETVSAERLRGKSLLLVEDDPMAAAALITWGESWGLRVTHYADPAAVPATLRPDLILSDIRLTGDGDGIEWLTEWLVQWPDARGLLISGELSVETHQRAEQEGLMLLSKPANPELLLQTLVGMVG